MNPGLRRTARRAFRWAFHSWAGIAFGLFVFGLCLMPAGVNSAGRHNSFLPMIRADDGVWREPFDSAESVATRWDYVTQHCFDVPYSGTLRMSCESGGLVSRQAWDSSKPIDARVWMRALPDPNSTTDRFWGGFTLLYRDDPPAGNNWLPEYVEVALERGIAPYNDGDPAAHIVHLTTPRASACCDKLAAYTPGEWMEVRIVYEPGQVAYFVNGSLLKTVRVTLGGPVRLDLLCVAVNPGESSPGARALCEFGLLEVRGTTVN